QDEILQLIPGAARPRPFMIDRELRGYEIADLIVVPSTHVAESFTNINPALTPKLFINPFGVSLDQFPVYERPAGTPTILFVGSWTYRKGADVLTNAMSGMSDVRLLHVGSLGDAPFPKKDPRFVHVEPVNQLRLREFYAQAHVFVLPSR